jgi:hypothetical protein
MEAEAGPTRLCTLGPSKGKKQKAKAKGTGEQLHAQHKPGGTCTMLATGGKAETTGMK